MTTDVKVLIAEFLRTHKRLVVPQLGAFIVKAPGGEILFSELFKRDDGVLRGLLTAAGASEIEAAGAIDRLIFDLRHAVQHGGVYLVAGLGTFSAGANGTLTFAYDPQAGAAAGPASALPPWRRKHPANPLRTGPLHPARADRSGRMPSAADGRRAMNPIPA